MITKEQDERYLRIKGYGLVVECDREKSVLANYGKNKSIMVYMVNHWNAATHNATFWRALGEAELAPLDYIYSYHQLTDKQVRWLYSIEPELEKFLFNSEERT